MTHRMMRRSMLSVLLATVLGTASCVETELSGVILDQDVDDPRLMLGMVRGVNSEMTDWFRDFDDGVGYMLGVPTDDVTNDGLSSFEERMSVGDFNDREDTNFLWEQMHESAWAGYHAVVRLEQVLGAEADQSPLTAQAWFVAGVSERFLGETFCELVYGYGPDGGALYGGDVEKYDNGRFVPRDSAFTRALFAFQELLAVAEAAVAAGAETPDGDPIFDPQQLVYKGHAGIAQAAANLGDWDLAVQHAAQVPDDFVAYEHHGITQENNAMYTTFYENDDLTMWGTPVALLWPDDPRSPFTICGEFFDGPRTEPGSRSEIEPQGCDHPSGEYRAESNTIPMYRSDKFPTEGADVPLMKGAEMRLIRAEAALLGGDLDEFKAQVDAARAIYALPPITLPTAAGALEYPNAEDDAWSILDRERLLTLSLEGRRMWDLDRWDHPFLTGNHVLTTRLYEDYGPTVPRNSCFPVSQLECDGNPNIQCPVIGG